MKTKEKCLKNRIVSYWTGRAERFGEVRKQELHNEIGQRWDAELTAVMGCPDPESHADLLGKTVLDVGTGTGGFAILLARHGCRVTGIDLTPAMIEEARCQAAEEGLEISFEVMDAQEAEFPDESFDYVVTRNLTWTLPDVEKAYRSWYRVLKTGGRLINFDANYAAQLREDEEHPEYAAEGAEAGTVAVSAAAANTAYGHDGVTESQRIENRDITLSMRIGREDRPRWDLMTLKKLGFRDCRADLSAGHRVLREKSNPDAPIFLVTAAK